MTHTNTSQTALTLVTSNRVLGLSVLAEGKFISYLRVSTDKQGKSGLGIEAQRQAVERYLNGGRWTVAAEYVETESGKRSDRPKLAAALAHAKAIKAKLVFAKLDRLTRNVDLLRSLVASDVDLVFCDLPNVPPGPMGRFLLTQMAAVAELEAGLIGERTRNALAAAKARGVKLGNPNGARALRGKQVGNADAIASIKARAAQRAADLRGIVADIKRSGITTVRGIADELHSGRHHVIASSPRHDRGRQPASVGQRHHDDDHDHAHRHHDGDSRRAGVSVRAIRRSSSAPPAQGYRTPGHPAPAHRRSRGAARRGKPGNFSCRTPRVRSPARSIVAWHQSQADVRAGTGAVQRHDGYVNDVWFEPSGGDRQ